MKLNLGCGHNKLAGYINIDKYEELQPDQIWDLEKTPYPFETNSVSEILLSHVLEHLGQSPDTFINIIKEFYRICKHNAVIDITVPHWRHDNFFSDPTHVRPITPLLLKLFDRELNLSWQREGAANSPLALIHKVNFKIDKCVILLDEPWRTMMKENKIPEEQVTLWTRQYANVVNQLTFKWRVLKT